MTCKSATIHCASVLPHGKNFTMRLVLPGDTPGGPYQGVHQGDPVVEFYDADMKGRCVDGVCYGRFVADFYMSTLSQQTFSESGIMSLHPTAAVWTLDSKALAEACKILEEWELSVDQNKELKDELTISF